MKIARTESKIVSNANEQHRILLSESLAVLQIEKKIRKIASKSTQLNFVDKEKCSMGEVAIYAKGYQDAIEEVLILLFEKEI